MGKTLLVLGHGYVAAALSRVLGPLGWRVIGTTRDQGKIADMAALGVEPHLLPGDDLTEPLRAASHILVSAAPEQAGDPMLEMLGDGIAELGGDLDWLGYLSTTAVYGDHQGDWVDEDTPLTPTTKRGQWRVEAERDWRVLSASAALPLHIFRLAGIYGPGRGPFSKVRAGTARRIIKPGQVFSRIHVDDIAQVLLASMLKPIEGAIYNVCDDLAAPPEDVIGLAAEMLGQPLPPAEPFDQAQLTPMARSFYAESKRVRNDRIKSELAVILTYPSYRDGLASLLASEVDQAK